MIHINKLKQKHNQVTQVRQSKKRSANLFLRLPNTDKMRIGLRLQVSVFLVLTILLTLFITYINGSSNVNSQADSTQPRIISNFNQPVTQTNASEEAFKAERIR